MRWFRKIICRIFGHNIPITFRPDGVYWCNGGYDCICLRCGWRWEESELGAETLRKSKLKDPREKGNK